MKKFGEEIKNVEVLSNTNNLKNNSSQNSITQEEFYINFNTMPSNPVYTNNVEGMGTLVSFYNGSYNNRATSPSLPFTIDPDIIEESLNPLIAEAKIYLNARGMSNAYIATMIAEENAQECDLVAYVAVLAEYELSGDSGTIVANNYVNLAFNSAYALPSPTILHCVGVALGIDALWALGGSNAATWTLAGMRTAFTSVAKRFLGPIGVAIAVVSFVLCMGDLIP